MKLVEATGILVSHLLLFGCIVLTIWLPANLFIEYLAYEVVSPDLAMTVPMRLNMLISGIFGPIVAGAVIFAAARIKQGRDVTYGEAMGAGFRNWGPLFGARLVAGILVGLGFLLFILPGIYLLIRWALLDSAVVLENAGVSESRNRSAQLVRGREIWIFGTGFFFIVGFMALAVAVSMPLAFVPSIDNFVVSAAIDCILDIVSSVIGIAMFLYYWEARQLELGEQPGELSGRDDMNLEEPPQPLPDIPDDGNPYRPPRA